MKNKIIIIFFIFFLSSLSSFTKGSDCLKFDGLSNLGGLEEFATDCATVKAFAMDESVKQDHQRKIYEKLAQKLAIQIKQNSEELSQLATFFAENNQDLLMKNKEVGHSCRLETVKKIETCGGKTTSLFQADKLAMLKKNFPQNNYGPFQKDQTLYGIMAGKFFSDLGLKDKSQKLQCPLNESSGNFFLNAQLNENSANYIVERIKAGDTSSDFLFNEYPQLKIIKNTNDLEFINYFKNYIRKMPKNVSSKDFISRFLFDPKNQSKIAPSLALQCEKMNQNLDTFLCSDLTNLASSDEKTSAELFDGLNPHYSLEDQPLIEYITTDPVTQKPTPSMAYIAYGMQCSTQKITPAISQDVHKNKSEQSVDEWYGAFTSNTRPEQNGNKKMIQDFCAQYTCSNDQAKKRKSCQEGGPLSAEDLSEILGCNRVPKDKLCNRLALQSISFLESLKKRNSLANDSSRNEDYSQQQSNERNEDSSSIPNFAKNYFGVTGSLIAQGKPVTQETISEKTEYFKKRGLETEPPPYSNVAINGMRRSGDQAFSNKMPPSQNSLFANPSANTISQNMNTQTTPANSQFVQASPQNATVSRGSSSTAPSTSSNTSQSSSSGSKITTPSTSSEDAKEIARIRAELENIVNQKVAAEEKLKSTSLGNSSEENRKQLNQINTYDTQARALKRQLKELQSRRNTSDFSRFPTDTRTASSPASDEDSSSEESSSSSSSSSNSAGMATAVGSKSNMKTSSDNNASEKGNTNKIASQKVATQNDLLNLNPEEFQKLGLYTDKTKSFTLKVLFENKPYDIVVQIISYNGKNILGPVINPQEKELKNFILKSPLFKPYIEYRNKNN